VTGTGDGDVPVVSGCYRFQRGLARGISSVSRCIHRAPEDGFDLGLAGLARIGQAAGILERVRGQAGLGFMMLTKGMKKVDDMVKSLLNGIDKRT